jgi:hypothetical protein
VQNNGIDVDLRLHIYKVSHIEGESMAGIQISAVASVLDNGISTIYETVFYRT